METTEIILIKNLPNCLVLFGDILFIKAFFGNMTFSTWIWFSESYLVPSILNSPIDHWPPHILSANLFLILCAASDAATWFEVVKNHHSWVENRKWGFIKWQFLLPNDLESWSILSAIDFRFKYCLQVEFFKYVFLLIIV